MCRPILEHRSQVAANKLDLSVWGRELQHSSALTHLGCMRYTPDRLAKVRQNGGVGPIPSRAFRKRIILISASSSSWSIIEALRKSVQGVSCATCRYLLDLIDYICGHGTHYIALMSIDRCLSTVCELEPLQHIAAIRNSITLATTHEQPQPSSSFPTNMLNNG